MAEPIINPVKPSPEAIPAPVTTAAPNAQQLLELLATVAELKAKIEAQPKPIAPPDFAAEIDWSKVSERDVANLNFYIPVVEHEMPDYMTIRLKDNNYIARWVHMLPAQLGMMLAAGYQYITTEDWDPNYPQVLQFNSEGHLTYSDVVGLKVHKSRYFGALRRQHQKSTQIGNVSGLAKVKGQVNQMIQNQRGMASAINRGALSFYDEAADSRVEQITI